MLPREPSYNTHKQYNHYLQSENSSEEKTASIIITKLWRISSSQSKQHSTDQVWAFESCFRYGVFWCTGLKCSGQYSWSGEISFPSAWLPGIVWHTETWPFSFTHWRPRGQSIISRSASSSPKKFPKYFEHTEILVSYVTHLNITHYTFCWWWERFGIQGFQQNYKEPALKQTNKYWAFSLH